MHDVVWIDELNDNTDDTMTEKEPDAAIIVPESSMTWDQRLKKRAKRRRQKAARKKNRP